MFLLALIVVRRQTLRSLVAGVGAAFGVVGLLAVLSRLYPGAFPHDQVLTFFPGTNERLNYPLNYANGTGNFLAIGLPLLLFLATRARTVAGQAVGAAAIPVSVLGIVLTASRGGVLTTIVAIVLFYALSPDRLPKLLTGLLAAGGSAILIAGLLHRSALRNGLSTPVAVTQRHQLTALLLLVCIGVALAQVGIALATRYAVRPKLLRISRRSAAIGTVVAVVVVLVVAIAAGVPGKLAHQWNLFKQTDVTGVVSGNVYSRLGTVTGSHRYQYWQTAVHAFKSKPLTGIGPGTFEFYWAQHGPIYEFIRNAHSLYLETLAEAGIPGFLLVFGLLAVVLITGIVRSLRAPPLARASLAAATASFAAFCVAAGYDWLWQLAVLPVAALLLAAAILSYSREKPAADISSRELAQMDPAARDSRRERGRESSADRDPLRRDRRDPVEPGRVPGRRYQGGPRRRRHRPAARAVRRHAPPAASTDPRGGGRPRGARAPRSLRPRRASRPTGASG